MDPLTDDGVYMILGKSSDGEYVQAVFVAGGKYSYTYYLGQPDRMYSSVTDALVDKMKFTYLTPLPEPELPVGWVECTSPGGRIHVLWYTGNRSLSAYKNGPAYSNPNNYEKVVPLAVAND